MSDNVCVYYLLTFQHVCNFASWSTKLCLSVDPSDVDTPQTANAFHRLSTSVSYPNPNYPSPPLSPSDDPNAFSYSNVSNVGRMRTSSIALGAGEQQGRETPRTKEKVKHTMSDSLISAGKRLVDWWVTKKRESLVWSFTRSSIVISFGIIYFLKSDLVHRTQGEKGVKNKTGDELTGKRHKKMSVLRRSWCLLIYINSIVWSKESQHWQEAMSTCSKLA